MVAKQLGRNQVVQFGQLNAIDQSDAVPARTRQFGGTLARDVMVPVLLQVQATDALPHAVELLLRTRLESLPVVDDAGKFLGLIAEEDLAARLLSPSGWECTVDEIVNRKTVCFHETTPITEICEFLQRAAIRRIVVLNKTDVPIGTISRGTILRWLRNCARVDAEACQEWSDKASELPQPAQQLSTTFQQLAERVHAIRQECHENTEHSLAPIINGVSQLQEVLEEALTQAGNARATSEATCGTFADLFL